MSTVVVFFSAVAALGQASAPGDKAEALWEAARKGDATTVKKLLDDGVDVNTKYRYGATALSYACDSRAPRGGKSASGARRRRQCQGYVLSRHASHLGGQPRHGSQAAACRNRWAAPEARRAGRGGRADRGGLCARRGDDEDHPRARWPSPGHVFRRARIGEEGRASGHRCVARTGWREAVRRVQDGRVKARALRR